MPDNPNARVIDILLVEDNDDDIVLMRDAFDEARLLNVVDIARDGQEALDILRDESRPLPGLVLLDINMPRLDGFETLAQIKADPRLASLPVVILTTSKRDEDVVRSYAGGACSYVSKPMDLDGLARIAEHFSMYWSLVSTVPAR